MVRKADPCAPVIPHGPADPGTCTCAPSTSAEETGGAISISLRSLPGATSGCCCFLPSVIFTVSKCLCRAPAHEICTPWALPFQTTIFSHTKSPSHLLVLHSDLSLHTVWLPKPSITSQRCGWCGQECLLKDSDGASRAWDTFFVQDTAASLCSRCRYLCRGLDRASCAPHGGLEPAGAEQSVHRPRASSACLDVAGPGTVA